MALVQTIGPTAEPISVTEAKSHLRVSHSTDDTLIGSLIAAAREYAERVTRRQLVVATYKLYMDAFPARIVLPRPPFAQLAAATPVQYVDTDGVTQTVAAATYSVRSHDEPAYIEEAYGYSWPTPRGVTDAVWVTYIAGYACPAASTFASDILTCSGRTYTDADIVRLTTTEGDLPSPLAITTNYHVRDVAGATLKLAAAAGGAAISLTDDGTGTHFVGEIPEGIRAGIKLLVGHLYENREATTELALRKVPLAVETLLWQNKMPEAHG